MKILHITRRILVTTSTLVLVNVALLTLATNVTSFNWRLFSVATGSMEPAIPTGSLIITKSPTSKADIQKNDVITFEQPGSQNKFITHRVEELVSSGGFITKGDANATEDPWEVSYGRISGVQVFQIPFLGHMLEFMKSPLGIALFIVVPTIIIATQEFRNIINLLVDRRINRILLMLRERGYLLTTREKNQLGAIQKPRHTTKQMKQSFTPIKKITIVPLAVVLIAILAIPASRNALAAFFSNTVTITQNSITTANVFPTPTVTPTVSPTPTASPTSSPSPTPTASPTPEPTDSPTPTPQVAGDCDLEVHIDTSNENTGPNSTNENEVDIEHDCTVTTENNATITNSIDVEANTGGNSQNGNTEAGDINTGDIKIDISIQNDVNNE